MFNQSKQFSFFPDSFPVELELLDSLVIDEIAYPWNPADPDSELYFQAIEQDCGLEELTDEVLAARTPIWVAQLEKVWQGVGAENYQEHRQENRQEHRQEQGAIAQVKEAIYARFADFVPVTWLEAIAHQAVEIIQTGCQELNQMSLAEQLVQCVHHLLPEWAKEDLQVLARPFAFAMRGNPAESTLVGADGLVQNFSLAGSCPWTELSDIERARVSFAIARYALTELNQIEEFRK